MICGGLMRIARGGCLAVIFMALAGTVTGCAGPVRVVIDGVETFSYEDLEPRMRAGTNDPLLGFCADDSLLNPAFWPGLLGRYRNGILVPDPNTGERECDVVISQGFIAPNTDSFVATTANSGTELVRAEGKSTGHFGTDIDSRAYRIINNRLLPGSPAYQKALSAKKAEEDAFAAEVERYRALKVKPALPEEARRFKVQAEAAFARKDFEGAVKHYRDALRIAPWWPEGHFNSALILGELGRYKAAIKAMKKYLLLFPNAPDSRAAQDKIYEWEGMAGK